MEKRLKLDSSENSSRDKRIPAPSTETQQKLKSYASTFDVDIFGENRSINSPEKPSTTNNWKIATPSTSRDNPVETSAPSISCEILNSGTEDDKVEEAPSKKLDFLSTYANKNTSSNADTTKSRKTNGPSVNNNKSYTPLEKQVVEIKEKNPDVLLFVECGYKYRFFGEDAEVKFPLNIN